MNSTLETLLGIIVVIGIIQLIYYLLSRNEKLRTLAGVVWIVGCAILFAMVASALYWTIA